MPQIKVIYGYSIDLKEKKRKVKQVTGKNILIMIKWYSMIKLWSYIILLKIPY